MRRHSAAQASRDFDFDELGQEREGFLPAEIAGPLELMISD